MIRLPKSTKHGAIVLAITAIFAGGYFFYGTPCIGEAGATTNVSKIPHEPNQKLSIMLPDFAEIAAQQGPAVVNN